MNNPFSRSNIYQGTISHRRFSPKNHSFNYSLFMMALDVADVENAMDAEPVKSLGIFGFKWYHPLRFVEKDYLRGEPNSLSQRIKDKVLNLNGYADIQKIVMLVQVRSFGIYFSPANFYFCYDGKNVCTQMLVEVSNTPWNERHYYLIDLLSNSEKVNKKAFQVSPFMDLDMSYFWHIKPPSDTSERLSVSIENKRIDNFGSAKDKIFAASLDMTKQPLNKKSLWSIWRQLPLMSVKIVISIYWQALRLFIKRIPFIGYQKAN